MTIRSRAPETTDDKTREILARRSERLRVPPKAEVEGRIVWVAEFPVGEDRFALPLSVLRSVVPLRRVTAVPLSRPHIVGILRFQGQIITALSMAALLGVQGWRHDPSVLLVIDPGWGRLVAIDCEEVPRSIGLTLTEDDQRRHEGTAILDVVHDGRVLHLLDLARLLDRRTGGRGG